MNSARIRFHPPGAVNLQFSNNNIRPQGRGGENTQQTVDMSHSAFEKLLNMKKGFSMFMQAESTEAKFPVKQARLLRDTQEASVHKTSGLSLFLKKRFIHFGLMKEKKITDVKIPDLSTENTCLFGFCSSFP